MKDENKVPKINFCCRSILNLPKQIEISDITINRKYL